MIVRKYFEVWTASSIKTLFARHVPTEAGHARPGLQRAIRVFLREIKQYLCNLAR